MKISTKKIEKNLGIKLIPFVTCLGIDTASRTGWAKIESNPDETTLDFGFIDMKNQDKYFKYDYFIRIFSGLLNPKTINKVVIEETFYGQNVKTFQMLSRLGAFAYTLACLNGIERGFILASSARKKLGLKFRKKKDVHADFLSKLKLDLDDEDVLDAIILAIGGIKDDRNN